MSKLYCLSCNSGTEYSGRMPNCCSNCGKPYVDTNIKASNKPKVKVVIQEDEDEPIEDDGNYEETPEINKFEFKLEGNTKNTEKFTFDTKRNHEVIQTRKSTGNKGKNPTKNQIQKQWATKFPKARENPSEIQ